MANGINELNIEIMEAADLLRWAVPETPLEKKTIRSIGRARG